MIVKLELLHSVNIVILFVIIDGPEEDFISSYRVSITVQVYLEMIKMIKEENLQSIAASSTFVEFLLQSDDKCTIDNK